MANFFIRRPIFAWVLAIILMMAGALAILQLPVAQYPTIAPPAVSVSANYPGVYRRRTDRPCSGYLPDCLPNGQHGSHSFYHSLLAYVPRLLLHRLFHRLETLRNPRLGLVHGFRYPCHSVFPFNIMATRYRSTLRSLHDFFYFPHHRTFPCHAFI